MKNKAPLLAFNRGIISRYALSRVDLERTALSAEEMTNWDPQMLGAMMLRPGLKYTGATASNLTSKTIPFIYALTDTARIELTDSLMRVWVDDELVTRPAVTAAVTNGLFTSNLTGWTDNDEGSAASSWVTDGASGGYMSLLGASGSAAIRDQQVTVNEANILHALRISILRGPVTLKVGSSSGGDQYINEVQLGVGIHSLAFTPTGNFYIRLMSRADYSVLVDYVTVESAGVMTITTRWGAANLPYIRYKQSGDVVYVACDDVQPLKIERRANDSWSLVQYEPVDGPFRSLNTSAVTLQVGALSGDTTMTASAPLFRSTHVGHNGRTGALFRIQSTGQTVSASISAQNTFTDPILVTGTGSQRAFSAFISGTFVATVTVQYSIAEPGAWVDYGTYAAGTHGITDGLDSQTIYYRIGVKTGGYTSGTAEVSLVYGQGTGIGTVMITGVTNSTTATVSILDAVTSLEATTDWWEGAWSDYRGWPSAIALHEGRVWMMGKDRIYGTVSDDFESYDDEVEGDSGPVIRSIGEGPVDRINWAMSLGRLVIGTESISNYVGPGRVESSSCLVARSNSFDEPLSPTNFNLKYSNTYGVYVSKSGNKLMQVAYDQQSNDYLSDDLSILVPDLLEDGIVAIGVQHHPDTRIHCVLGDGTVAILTHDKAEQIKCWFKVETDGEVEDVCVLPGTEEDSVYYTIKRTIDGSDVRYHEKWALRSECRGGTLNKQADSFIEYSGVSTTTLSVAHLEGEDVVVWGGGAYLGEYTVSGGQITGLSSAVTSAIVGLPYSARFKSSKLARSADGGILLNETKRVRQIGLGLLDTHKDGLYYGPDFDNLDPLPDIEDGTETDDDYVWEAYDKDKFSFNGTWDSDSRVCLKADAPKPCTVASIVIDFES